jgi:hypothetical protein
MPQPKYRRPVAKEHKEKLEAFSFASAWRRKSSQSMYSPMGSRAVSRNASVASAKNATAGGRKSFQQQRGNNDTVVEDGADRGDVGNGK